MKGIHHGVVIFFLLLCVEIHSIKICNQPLEGFFILFLSLNMIICPSKKKKKKKKVKNAILNELMEL